jgi:biotin carboxylase
MKARLQRAGVRVIRDLDPATVTVPCVVKAVQGAAAMGVHICRTPAELEPHRAALAQPDGVLLEEYVEGDCFHIDGAFTIDQLVAMPHAYVNDCHGHYVDRKPLGSVGVDDPVLRQRLVEFTRRVIRALPLLEGVFHLEVIRTRADELVFLEVACRVGGGEIYQNFIDTYGLDLLGFHIDSDLGRSPALRPLRHGDVAGWLMLNDFPHRPGVFTGLQARPLRADSCMYGIRAPKLGRPVGNFDYVSFALRGDSSAAVRASIDDIVTNISLQTEAA